jgi:hypothetical protein
VLHFIPSTSSRGKRRREVDVNALCLLPYYATTISLSYIKQKIKLFLALIKHHTMKTVGNGSVTSRYMKVCGQLQAQAVLTLEKRLLIPTEHEAERIRVYPNVVKKKIPFPYWKPKREVKHES